MMRVFGRFFCSVLPVGGVLLVMSLQAPEAKACAFNCNDLRASGFVTKTDDASPFANSYKGDTPEPRIDNAQDKKLVIWLHGQGNPRKKESCSARYNLPPKSVLKLDEMPGTHVYYHCTAIVDPKEKGDNKPDDGLHYTWGYKNGSYTLARRDELSQLLDKFIALGVKPENITIAGHSAGGWTALLAAASYPDKFNSLIAFAPAFAGVRREESVYPWWRKIIRPEQIEMIKTPNDIKKLIFAYEDDAFNRPQELSFITDSFPETASLVSQNCGGGHNTHKNDCKLMRNLALMKELVLAD